MAEQVGTIISGYTPRNLQAVPSLLELLDRYAQALTPWAERVGAQMISEVNQRDRESWRSLGNAISAGLREQLLNTPIGEQVHQQLTDQVRLIKSLPVEAGQRVHELTLKGLSDGTRAREIAKEIARSGEVAESRARLIAHTEVSRTAEILVETRARYVGSPGYFWETARDGAVRPSHKKMQGVFVLWNAPVTLDDMTGHAGCFPFCRCWTRVALPA